MIKIKTLLLFVAIYLLCYPCFLLSKQVGNPWFWLAEKQDTRIYLLGTLHFGISLEDLACSKEITDQLINSDFVFVELLIPETVLDLFLSSEDVSKEAHKRVIDALPQEEKQIIEQRRLAILRMYYGDFEYNGDEGFEDLSPTARDFLIDKDIDLEGDYADYMLDLYHHVGLELLFLFPKKLDFQINAVVLSHNRFIQPLDDNAKILKDAKEANLGEPQQVSRASLETFITEGYNQELQHRIAEVRSSITYYSNPNKDTLPKIKPDITRDSVPLERSDTTYDETPLVDSRRPNITHEEEPLERADTTYEKTPLERADIAYEETPLVDSRRPNMTHEEASLERADTTYEKTPLERADIAYEETPLVDSRRPNMTHEEASLERADIKYKKTPSIRPETDLSEIANTTATLQSSVHTKDNIDPYIRVMLKNRNERWVQKIKDVSSLNQDKSIFVAAGFEHFTNVYNVIAMLEADNYTVRQMTANCIFPPFIDIPLQTTE